MALTETFSTTVLFFFQVEKIRQVKAKSLYLQVEKLHQSLTKLDSTIAAVSQVLDEGRHLDVLLARERMLTQIHELKALRGLLQPQEDDRFMFTPPDQVGSLLPNMLDHERVVMVYYESVTKFAITSADMAVSAGS